MGRRRSKDRQILEEAWQRFEASAEEVSKLETQLAIAKATSSAHQQAYNALAQSLAPQPRQSAGTATTNSGMARAMKDSLSRAAKSTSKKSSSSTKKRAELSATNVTAQGCLYRFDIDGGKTCGSTEDSGIHDPAMGYSGYHPFVSPARNAQPPSSTSGAGASTIPNSEAVTASAQGAAGGSSERGN